MAEKKKKLGFMDLWDMNTKTVTAETHLDLILGSVKKLPLKFWRVNFLFKGALDQDLIQLTQGRFPAIPKEEGTHPVFSLKAIGACAGFMVCPCSSARQWKKTKWIEQGTRLLHTGCIMDRQSYLIEWIQFNIPDSVAGQLVFQGEVPSDALLSYSKKGRG